MGTLEKIASAVPWLAAAYAIGQITKPEVVTGVTTLAGVGERTFGTVIGGTSGLLKQFTGAAGVATAQTEAEKLSWLDFLGAPGFLAQTIIDAIPKGDGGSPGEKGVEKPSIVDKIKTKPKTGVPEMRFKTYNGITITQERKPGSSVWRNVTR